MRGYFLILLLVCLFGSSCLLPYAFTVSKAAEISELPYEASHHIVIDDIPLHYQLLEPSENPIRGSVLLVHGLGGSSYSFMKVAPVLQHAGYRVVSVDLPGFGYSSRLVTGDYSQKQRANLLWQLLSRLDERSESWHLVGHSMGGGTVAAMAVDQPHRTQSVVFIAGALEDQHIPGQNLILFPPFTRWVQLYLERNLLQEDRVARILEEAYHRNPTEEEVIAYLEPLQIPGTARSLTRMVVTSESVNLSTLSDLSMPATGIWGEYDTIVPLSQAYTIARYMNQFVLYRITGAGHIPMETHERITAQILLDHLDRSQVTGTLSNKK
jgi:pimeloyl-ACP methyl ester carboxylesterase